MAVASSSDVVILTIGIVLAALYLFRDQIFSTAKPKAVSLSSKISESDGNPRDFIAKMKNGVSTHAVMIYLEYSFTVYTRIEKTARHLLWLANRHR
jgi:hypothetical protein